ncbi:MAG: hypothetical protein JNJ58_09465 [Chitinophagaceae bacterium]|nr:hypothetical protein [Chitinophagaceae bacterium]
MFRFVWFLCLAIQICPTFTSAQTPLTKRFSVNEGLSQSTVTKIYQSPNGLLWIGTGDGLNVYDGYTIRNFKHQPSDSFSISSNTIRSILYDSIRHCLWVGTTGGLNELNLQTLKFKNRLKGVSIFNQQDINIVGYHQDGIYFFAPQNGIYFLSTKTGKLFLKFVNKQTTHVVNYSGHNGLWWDNHENAGLHHFTIGSDRIETFRFSGSMLPNQSAIYSILDYAPDKVLVSSTEGLFWASSKSDILYTDTLLTRLNQKLKTTVMVMIPAPDHQILLSTENKGLLLLSPDLKNVQEFKSTPINHINHLFFDQHHNLWIGTLDDGLHQWTPSKSRFKLLNPESETNALSSGFVRSIYADHQFLLVGYFDKGLDLFDRNTGFKKHLNTSNSALSGNTVLCIQSLSDHRYLLGTESGINVFNTQTNRLSPVSAPTDTPFVTAYCMVKDGMGNIYIGTNSGVYQYDDQPSPKLHFVGLKGFYITTLFYSQSRKLYAYAKNNKALYDVSNHTVVMSADRQINHILEYAGMFLLATNQGIVVCNRDFSIRWIIEVSSGLPDNFINAILQDSEQNLWFSCNKGIGRISLRTAHIQNFTPTDGLQSPEFNTGASFKAEDGTLYFGGINGLNYFQPKEVKFNQTIPNILLTGIKLFDKKLPEYHFLSPISDTEKDSPHIFPYFQNTFTFSTTSLDLTQPEQNQYAFKLEGAETEWYNNGHDPEIRYPYLKPGEYKFYVKASNADGFWSPPVCLYHFIIKPPYWKTAWFITLIVLLSIGVVSFTLYRIIRSDYQRKMSELKRLQEIEKIRLGISKDIHDDIGASLTRIGLISEIAKKNLQNVDLLEQQLHKISNTSRAMTTGLKEIVWSTNPEHDNLPSLLSFIQHYALEYCEHAELDLRIRWPEKIETKTVSPDFRRNIFLIFKEVLNNIVKHASASVVEIDFTLDQNQMFTLSIQDNGKGFNSQEVGQFSNGLKNIQKRAAEIRCSVQIDSSVSGTKMTIQGTFS